MSENLLGACGDCSCGSSTTIRPIQQEPTIFLLYVVRPCVWRQGHASIECVTEPIIMRLQEAMISLYKSQLFHSLRPQLTPIHLPDSSLLLIICNRVSNFYHFIIWYHSQPQPVINDIALHINPPWRCTVRVAVQALSGLGSVFTDQVFQKTVGLGYSWGAELVVWFIMSSAFAVIISIGQ